MSEEVVEPPAEEPVLEPVDTPDTNEAEADVAAAAAEPAAAPDEPEIIIEEGPQAQGEEQEPAIAATASAEAVAPPAEGEASEEVKGEVETPAAEGEAEGEEKPEEEAKAKEAEGEEEAAQRPSDFRLREQTDDFLGDQEEVPPDIPSQVSQLTELTQDEEGAAPVMVTPALKTAIALSRIDEEGRKISGDFAALPAVKLISKTSIQSFHTEIEAGSEGSLREEAPPAPEALDREPYYEAFNRLTGEVAACKVKNNFLQRKMAEYFRKRKMEHVLKETDQHVDTQQKYYKRLDMLDELLQRDQTYRLVINAELDELRAARDERLDFIKKTMKQLFDREREISTGLIHTKTGKEIPQKVIERLLRRQTLAIEQVAKLRLKYIKIRNRVTEKQEALQSVDKLGNNLRLVDYEQLKIENRGYADKVEERDEELTKLRVKCDSIFQVLAHLREKSASATLDTIKEQQVLQGVEIEFMEARERTNYFKIERDRYRSMINKLREETGILFKPRLLEDMENAINEVETTEKLLKEMQEKQKTQLSQLRAIRKNIEVATNYKMLSTEEKIRGGPSKVFSKMSTTAGLCKGRPQLPKRRQSQ